MFRGRSCILVSQKDGKKYSFPSMKDASIWLGRSHAYVKDSIRNGRTINSSAKEAFDVEVSELKKNNLDSESYIQIDTNDVYRKPEQKCITCARSCGLCCWSDHLEPVKGWTASPSYSSDEIIYSYSITDCPLYEEDAPTAKERRKQFKRLKGEFNGRKKDVRQDNSVE